MEVRGFIKTSLLDFEGKIVSLLFVGGCNFRCPYCQNAELVLNPEGHESIPREQIDAYLQEHKDFIDGICLTGGEPCLYNDLAEYFAHFKEMGFLVKLDTNGSRPGILKGLIQAGVVDYIAMDIKAPLDFESYSNSTGVKNKKLFEGVKESINIIMGGEVDYEFRTTVVPTLHESSDIEEVARSIRGARRFILQNFRAKDTLDPAYSQLVAYPLKELKKMAQTVSDYVKESRVRGK